MVIKKGCGFGASWRKYFKKDSVLPNPLTIREISFREQELKWLFVKYTCLENNRLYGSLISSTHEVRILPHLYMGNGTEGCMHSHQTLLPSKGVVYETSQFI